jgi:hypothetical protein
MICSTHYTQSVSGCVSDLNFTIPGITSANDWTVRFTFQSGASVQQPIIFNGYTDEFTISNENYWHIGTGEVVFEFFNDEVNCASFEFTHCDATYNGINIDFTNIQTENDYVIIPCNCPE